MTGADWTARPTYLLIHGAAADSWCWHLLAAELRARGNDVVAVDLPCDDDSAGLSEYADAALGAIGDRPGSADRGGLVVVAHSFGAFTAPVVCDRTPVELLVLLGPQIPLPGETPGDWWANTGYPQARREQDVRDGRAEDDLVGLFANDLPPDLVTEVFRRGRHQADRPFGDPVPVATWPDVPTRVLLHRDDRFLPADFVRRVARKRLGIEPDEMPGGHLGMLGHPIELADRLDAYRAGRAEVAGRD
ncbi:alpha/beta hydrolase [Plantactinospora veratri]|uniref:Alpha/beta hydrolase n=1 Tax=Plantactinospora veratri TaxID=1436122 RepID=A0ABU7SB28_9ACTN